MKRWRSNIAIVAFTTYYAFVATPPLISVKGIAMVVLLATYGALSEWEGKHPAMNLALTFAVVVGFVWFCCKRQKQREQPYSHSEWLAAMRKKGLGTK